MKTNIYHKLLMCLCLLWCQSCTPLMHIIPSENLWEQLCEMIHDLLQVFL